MADGNLRPALPFGVPAGGRFGIDAPTPGVRVRLLTRHAHVLVQPMKGRQVAATAALETAFGLRLPPTGRAFSNDLLALSWAGAGAWMATAPTADLADRLAAALGEDAAVIDQTDGRCLFRIDGRDVRRTLEKGTTLDLHPRAFATGQAAATVVAHLAAGIRQTADTPAYEVSVTRSSARDFWHWLADSASEFGLELESPDA